MFRGGWSITSSESLSRRGLFGGLGLLALGGCGFRPLYGSSGTADVRAELSQIRVAIIQERFGQLLRRALTQRMGQSIGGPSQALYELQVAAAQQAEGVGIQRDGTPTRVRYIGTANWLLARIGPPRETLATGTERAIEAYNIPPNQFFAADSSREAAEHRLAETLAELVVTRIVVDFRRREAGAAGLAQGATMPAAAPSPVVVQPARPELLPGLTPALR
ncbi:LPS assembly lipoprotein LptE [Falsiroseomonas sp.]|uniref:LPS assembly lipoprotein LptE n=1 Tax=Falsiroseomonas sp. TaxID=2870721 RepID=UPI002737366B|nr:LPS assembly lipoprotein LptE [Falsiroseomonas sp.]MDP3415002.1 LPS assembly lipoprotein LptE [Falsiroseomonas sp.]